MFAFDSRVDSTDQGEGISSEKGVSSQAALQQDPEDKAAANGIRNPSDKAERKTDSSLLGTAVESGYSTTKDGTLTRTGRPQQQRALWRISATAAGF